MKKTLKFLLCIVLLFSAVTFYIPVAAMSAPSAAVQTTGNEGLVLRLDFENTDNLGENSILGGEDAVVVNKTEQGGFTVTQNAVKGQNALNFPGTGVRENYIELPASLLANKSVSFGGWFKLNLTEALGTQEAPTPFSYRREWQIWDGSGYTEGYGLFSCPMTTDDGSGADNTGYGYKLRGNLGQTATDQFVNYTEYGVMNGHNAAFYYGQVSPVYDAWYHMMYVFTPEKMEIYQNGALVSSREGDYSLQNVYGADGTSAKFWLGAQMFESDLDYKGSMADFRVYDRALTAEDIAADYALSYEDFLIAEYAFEGEGEETLTDGMRGYEASLNNTAKAEDGVLTLDGAFPDENVTGGSSLSLNKFSLLGCHGLTVSTDLKITEFSKYARVWQFSLGSDAFLALYTNHNNNEGELVVNFNYFGAHFVYDPAYKLPLNTWVNVTVTVSATEAAIYVNGEQVVNGPIAVKDENGVSGWMPELFFWAWDRNNTDVDFRLGVQNAGIDEPIRAQYDNFRIYAKTLTQSEVTDLADKDTYINATVRYLLDDGSLYKEEHVRTGTPLEMPQAPVKDETETHTYVFDGWVDEQGAAYTFGEPVTGDLTLIATFIEIEKPPAEEENPEDTEPPEGETPEQDPKDGDGWIVPVAVVSGVVVCAVAGAAIAVFVKKRKKK